MRQYCDPKSSRSLWTSAALAIAAIAGSAGLASAQVYWDGGGGTNTQWSNAANWDTFGSDTTPTFVDNAYLNNGGTISVGDLGNQTASLLIGAAADTGLNANNLGLGGTVNFNAGGGLSTASSIPTIDIGVDAGSTSVWNHNGGTVTTGELFRVGVNNGGTGTLNMHAGLIDVSTGDTGGLDFFLIGDNGNGTLNMDGGEIKSRGLFGVALQAGSTSVVNMSGGTITTNAVALIGANSNIPAGVGAKATLNLSGGSIVAKGTMVFADSAFATATVNHTGGTIDSPEILIGKWSDTTYNLSGTGVIQSAGQVNIATFTPIERPEGAANAPKTVVTQSGSSSVVAAGMVVGEFGHAVYNMNGGSIHLTGVLGPGGLVPGPQYLNLLIGRDGGGSNQGLGEFTQTAGSVQVDKDVFLGDFDDSTGVYTISGGTLNVLGSAHIGAALASNAPPDAIRLEPSATNGAQGQALRASGAIRVKGGDATINIGGQLLANPGDKGAYRAGPGNDNHATLGFEIGAGGLLSRINVAQQADLDGAIVDMGFLSTTTYVPSYLQQFELVNASLFGSTGTGTTQNVGTGSSVTLATGDELDWSISVISAAGGRMTLVATNQVVPGDTDNNKKVNFDDLLALAQNYGMTTGATRAKGDFNRTASVNFDDLLVLAQNYGFGMLGELSGQLEASSSLSADWALAQSLVPEPASLGLLAGSSIMSLRRRRC